jgi:rRNA maturation protein Rpf1
MLQVITNDLLKSAFIDLVDEGWKFTISGEDYIVKDSRTLESGKTISAALKRIIQHSTEDEFNCNKQVRIHLSRQHPNVLNFSDFRRFQEDFITSLSSFCEEIGIDEEMVNVETYLGNEYTIIVNYDDFEIKNVRKFVQIQKDFNVKFNGQISISLVDHSDFPGGIKLQYPGSHIGGLKWIEDNKQLYDKAISFLEKHFVLEKRGNFVYLHPKFEFITNETV